ncbi:MAG: helix-turn-helix domain-containing protein [Limisphaerales bacterium]
MFKISGRINQTEREIAARVRRIRRDRWLSQPAFAAAIGETFKRMANIEYARTPLTVGVADKIAENFAVSVIWLATGEGSPRPYVGKIRAISPKTSERALLSRAFDATIRRAIIERHSSGLVALLKCVTTWDELPLKEQYRISEAKVSKFLAELQNSFSGLSPIGAAGLQDMLEEVIRNYSCDWDEEQPTGEIRAVRKKLLTSLPSLNKTDGVNHWHTLKAKLQNATESRGGRSTLAKFLGVDLTQISRWLSKAGPEPGADYTLKMLQWVQERKSQQ